MSAQAKKDLENFLRDHYVLAKSGSPCTHTRIPEKEGRGGSYVIPLDRMPDFQDAYYRAVFKYNHDMRLNEVLRGYGNMRVDLDLKYTDRTIIRHMHTLEQVRMFGEEWLRSANDLVVLPAQVRAYVLMKDKPVERDDGRVGDGLKFLVPGVGLHNMVLDHIRKCMLPSMPGIFGDLPLENTPETWEEVYDKGNSGWTVYGSKKPGNLPYRVTHEVIFDRETNSIVDLNEVNHIEFESIPENVAKMTAICQENDILPFTEMGNAVLGHKFQKATAPDAGRRAPGTVRPKHWEVDTEEIFAHVDNIANNNISWDDWYKMGQTLFNLGSHDPDSFYNAWVQWSAKSKKHDLSACEKTWRGLSYRQEGPRTGIRTILLMSQASNPDRFKAIQDDSIFRLIITAVSTTTDYDIARIMYRMYSDRFRCAGFTGRGSLWYEFKGHTWEVSDEIVVRQLMSTEVFNLFNGKTKYFWDQLEDADAEIDFDDSASTKTKGKREKSPEQKKAERMCKNLLKILGKLKTSGAKSSILRECCELFYEAGFMEKLDKNPMLLGCLNGVFDMSTLKFRDGVPEDHISKNTGVSYDPNKHWSEVKRAAEVMQFMKDILPDEEVREYNMDFITNSLCGTYETQAIHIGTGAGKNGKSMEILLIQASFGSYYCVLPISLLTRKRGNAGSATPELMDLKGARFATLQEPDEGEPLNTGMMKELTGEYIKARPLYGPCQEFKIQAKVLLLCNDKPPVNGKDDGTWRRLRVIFYPIKFVGPEEELGPNRLPCDPLLSRKIPQWGEAFLAMLIQRFIANGGVKELVAPPKVLQYSEEYRQQNDGMAKFGAENIEAVPSNDATPVTVTALKAAFTAWKDMNRPFYNGLKPDDLMAYIEKRFGKRPSHGWKNFRFRTDDCD